jgi:hypothetical protein
MTFPIPEDATVRQIAGINFWLTEPKMYFAPVP